MERINLDNYEAFLLEYFEGNLKAEDCALLKRFVLSHPELEIDLEDTGLPYLYEERHVADFKDNLKKNDTEIPNEELIDYQEGNLPEVQIQHLENKLKHNKELARKLELLQKTRLVADSAQVYDRKAALLRTEEDMLLNNKVILYLENQLSGSEKKQFETDLSLNPDLQKELHLTSKTRLMADESIVYPSKETLKKKNRVIVLFGLRTIGSLAAAILLLFGLVGIIKFYNTNKNEVDVISEVKKYNQFVVPPQNTDNTLSPAETKIIKKESVKKNTATSVRKKTVSKEETPKQNSRQSLTENTPGLVHTTELKINKDSSLLPEAQNTEIVHTAILQEADPVLEKRNYLALAEGIYEETDIEDNDNREVPKNNFWKRAVKLARKANKLGVKAIDGQEDSEDKYRLSFNSFSVEKK